MKVNEINANMPMSHRTKPKDINTENYSRGVYEKARKELYSMAKTTNFMQPKDFLKAYKVLRITYIATSGTALTMGKEENNERKS